MSPVVWLFFLHVMICLALLVLRVLGIIRCAYISLFIAFFVPVWGMGMLLLKRFSDRHQDRMAADLELKRLHAEEIMRSISVEEKGTEAIPLNEALVINDSSTRRQLMMDILYEVNRSIAPDSDDMQDMTVPLEEAMIVNDSATRRTLLIEALYSNPTDYVPQLFDAKANEDTEVVHYAATALTEIQKHYDLQFQALAKKRVEHPDDPKLEDENQALLEQYIASGLLKGDALKTQLRSYSSLLEHKIQQQDVRGKWGMLKKKASADLRLGDAAALEWDVQQMGTEWADREEYWIYRIECAVLKRDAGTIRTVIRELEEKDFYQSQQLRSIISFWGGDREGTAATT